MSRRIPPAGGQACRAKGPANRDIPGVPAYKAIYAILLSRPLINITLTRNIFYANVNKNNVAGIAQVVERGPEKPGVGGATPSPGTTSAKAQKTANAQKTNFCVFAVNFAILPA